MEQTISKKIATGAFAVLVAGTLSFPSLAVALESGTVDGTDIANGTEASGEGWSYDGADEITLDGYDGGLIRTVGETVIQLVNENTVEDAIITQDGDLTIKGDASASADDKPVLNMKASELPGAYIQARNSNPESDDSHDLTIEGATVNFEKNGMVFATGDIEIDNSYVGVENEDKYYLDIYSSGAMTISESVIDGGTNGTVSSKDTLTIDNSDVTVLGADEANIANRVYSATGIVLKNMANGEVKEYTDEDGNTWYYVDTNDGASVKLKAAGTPGYYTGTKGMPQTGDSTGVVAAGVSAAALAAMGALFLSTRRKHGKHEA